MVPVCASQLDPSGRTLIHTSQIHQNRFITSYSSVIVVCTWSQPFLSLCDFKGVKFVFLDRVCVCVCVCVCV